MNATRDRQSQLPAAESGNRDEVRRLKRTLRDVAALSAMPAIWVDRDVRRSLQNLTDVLRTALGAAVVCAQIELPDNTCFCAVSSRGLGRNGGRESEAREILDAMASDKGRTVELPGRDGAAPLQGFVHPVHVDGQRVGYFGAGFGPDKLPDEEGRLVFQVAASQVALLFQRLRNEEERFARRLAEERLQQAEHRYRQILQSLPAAVYTCDAEGRIDFYNQRAAELWGREVPLRGEQVKFCAAYRCLIDGKPVAPDQTPMVAAVREGRAFRNLEPVFERADGRRISVLVNIDPLLDAEGRPCGAINVFQDISETKETQKELQRRTDQLSAFLETAALGLHRVGRDGVILWANAAELEMLGYSSDEYIGRHIAEFYVDRPVIDDILVRLGGGEKIYSQEARLRHKDGSIRDVLIDSNVLWEDGKFIHTQCFTRDITEQRKIERDLRESEARFRSLVNSVEGIVWECAIEPEGFRFTFVSEEAERLLGYPTRQWLEERGFLRNHMHPDDRALAIDYSAVVTKDGTDHDFEYRMIAADGRTVWLRDLVTVVVVDDRPVKLVGVMVDVTERKKVEEALRESEASFRQLADSMPQIVWTARPDGHLDYYNRRWYELTGAEMGGTGDESWLPVLHPDDRRRSLDTWNECVRTGSNYEIEYRFCFPPGNEYRWQLGRALPVRDAEGNIIRWFGTCTDIDDQKRAEDKLERAVTERTASLREAIAQMEEFSYSMSHDLRGPLRAMQGYCHILLEDAAAEISPENLNYLKRIAGSAERLDRLVQDVLAYTRVSRQDMEMKPIAMDPLVTDLIYSLAESHHPLPEIFVEKPLRNVIGHEPSMVQCLSNLVGNALKFIPAGRAPRICIRTEKAEPNSVRLWVEDNGIGIPAEQTERIFQIFERSPDVADYPGTGVGLSIVRKAIQRMHGEVGVLSEPGSGSRFWIQLPLAGH